MKHLAISLFLIAFAGLVVQAQRPQQPPPYQMTAEEQSKLEAKTAELSALVDGLNKAGKDSALIADVDIYRKAAQWALEFPEHLYTPEYYPNALTVLDQGIERAKLLADGKSPWMTQKGRSIQGYFSDLDGSVQPYGLSVPDTYDGSKAVPLFVFLHGRSRGLTEVSFITSFPQGERRGSSLTFEAGQIHLDVYGRGNNAYHWAGEVDIFEAIDAVKQRYNIDPDRVVLRGFSLGGAGAWHLALHHPDNFAAAEIGAGTWPRRHTMMDQFPEYQAKTLNIWENSPQWALNAFNLPLAGHGGDGDDQVASIPPPVDRAASRGQLESSLRARAQLESEGFKSAGEPDFLKMQGLPAIFLISQDTKHATSDLVRERLNAFIKEHLERGRISPDHIRFLTYTTRYNKSHWATLDVLDEHYQRAEIDAQRTDGGKRYEITTKNLARLTLRETNQAERIHIDGKQLSVKGAPSITLAKGEQGWTVAAGPIQGLRKVHGLQGPIDDAFLDPFLLVRPTGTPWNKAANDQALQRLAEFDHLYAMNYRAHPRIKNDRDVTMEDFEKYNVALFGDPGSNKWLAQIAAKLPVGWTKESVNVGDKTFAAAEHLPVLAYPNPLNPSRYVVVNSGLTIAAREYNGDYSMPQLGDFAVLKAGGDVATAGLFDEQWKLPAKLD